MKMKRWMDHFDFLTHNLRNNNQQLQLNNVKMFLRVQFQARIFKCVNFQVFSTRSSWWRRTCSSFSRCSLS